MRSEHPGNGYDTIVKERLFDSLQTPNHYNL